MKAWILAASLAMVIGVHAAPEPAENRPLFRIVESWDIAEVPSEFPVGFCLLTRGRHQYVAYYDSHRRMTVASRSLDSTQWRYHVLPANVGWDSHNYITMAVDDDGYLHLSGNMHGDPLMYFRTSAPWDITTFEPLHAMTGRDERQCTYPAFMRDADNRLLFHYRDGESGGGNEIFTVYDHETRTWSRLLGTPLTDGQGHRNAYFSGPHRGPDGWFHIVWVWRDTPDCATNHHLSYARSRDLVQWESAAGEKVDLPITLNHSSLWVDPIPSGGGIINGCQHLAFDQDTRPVVTYHKADADGHMQIYATRFEDGGWVQHRLTDWSEPIPFGGTGAMGFIGLSMSGLSRVSPGTFTMTYRHRSHGSGRLFIDEATLRPIDPGVERPREYPAEVDRPRIDFEGMGIRRAGDLGGSGEEGVHYELRWETLPPNRDLPRQGPLPPPSLLRLYKLSALPAP